MPYEFRDKTANQRKYMDGVPVGEDAIRSLNFKIPSAWKPMLEEPFHISLQPNSPVYFVRTSNDFDSPVVSL